ncbi:BZ3500_MvSof-1268-A1-R1_Chr2-2g04963 [Microbotryum saponariae]|uniref:BZ3500_MvSof-1268-A1-R1_Chr2-2g04963 protein n=1 Tax=Microbotryum saponariae TaxID=289078 RepID=A0A2X0L1Y8_9BASI|nr:BZ3500_MvSof-1268-A1-R1_Chr2-2g04963 [Microbotryum saponariae]SDA00574.1 BZ3501_MvSof-1269-A2-R1_Chr2-2g04637 [Microbotryum saponariae]
MSSPPIKVAVLGFGMSAQVFHIPFIQSLSQHSHLTTILERSATADSSKARDAFPEVKVVTHLQHVLDDDELELVFVSTINDTHYEYTKAILNAGKHVVCEKALTPTSAEAYELAELASKKNLVLAVYQNRRWDSDFLTLKQVLAENRLGELSEFTSHFDRYKNEAATTKLWKEKVGRKYPSRVHLRECKPLSSLFWIRQDLPGSGAAYDLGSHLVDQILALFGKPQAVTGFVRNSRSIGNPDVPDSFLIHLHYPSTSEAGRRLPLIATARGSVLSLVSPQMRFTVKGTKGAFIEHGLDVQEDQLKKGAKSAVDQADFGVEPKELQGTLYEVEGGHKIETETGNYKAWFENVAEVSIIFPIFAPCHELTKDSDTPSTQAIRSKDRSKLIVTPEAAALTIEIIEKATQSSKEGRTIQL